jgi:hypothetical protein
MKIENLKRIKSEIISGFNRGVEDEILGINSLACRYFNLINSINQDEIEINTCKVDRRKIKFGNCYGNSSNRLSGDHLYVEGISTKKKHCIKYITLRVLMRTILLLTILFLRFQMNSHTKD